MFGSAPTIGLDFAVAAAVFVWSAGARVGSWQQLAVSINQYR